MRRFINLFLLLAAVRIADAAALPAEWQFMQSLEITNAGIVKISLPAATLAKALPGLDDLRVYSEAGAEIPYLIQRPAPAPKVVQAPKTFQVALAPAATVITIETGMTQPIDGVTLSSPAQAFIKPVRIEGSTDGARWETVAQGRPIFRQYYGASQLQLSLPPRPWPWLRLTLDDRRSQPVPFTGAQVHAAAPETVAAESTPATISQRHENPGESRLSINLGAANLDIAAIHIETDEPLFTRSVTVAVPQASDTGVSERVIAEGSIYRMAIEGQPASAGLSVKVEQQVRSAELLLRVKNYDSPPLSIKSVRIERRPVYLVFHTAQSGRFQLLTGNPQSPAPRYDLSGFGGIFRDAPVTSIMLSEASLNPAYRLPEILPGVQDEGTSIDLAGWRYRQPLHLSRPGAHALELDLDMLAHAQPSFHDLRLIRQTRQVPYVLERTSIERAISPIVTVTNDMKDRTVSRWILRLPKERLPIHRLSCASDSPLFQRDISIYEAVPDDRGEVYNRSLASATWTQTPDRKTKEFAVTLSGLLTSDTLIVETRNGDNPPIQLRNFQLYYSPPRILFKAPAREGLEVYYGNEKALAPRYDIALVAGQLVAAEKAIAESGPEQTLIKPGWSDSHRAGRGGIIFWGALALVVVALLVVIARLLPKAPPAA